MIFKNILDDYVCARINYLNARSMLEEYVYECKKNGEVENGYKAQLCIQYMDRYRAFQDNRIGRTDFLIFLYSFLIFVGSVRLHTKIYQVIKEFGGQYNIVLHEDGTVVAVHKYPSWLTKKENKFIEDTYRFYGSNGLTDKKSIGDKLLIDNTVFNTYKSVEQKVAVHSAVNMPDDYTLMVSLPTGSGKSLIADVLAAADDKLTLVIVPTVSLAQDQRFQAMNVIKDADIRKRIYYYESGMEYAKKNKIKDAIRDRTARLIFISPEAVIRNKEFKELLEEAASTQYLHNIVIDEAHIIPDWGVLFRPEFQILSVVIRYWIRERYAKLRMYLLSATLTDEVVDILKNLYSENGRFIEYRCDALRKEPKYIIHVCRTKDDRKEKVMELAAILPKPTILYVTTKEDARMYKEAFQKAGCFNIDAYTSESTDKGKLLRRWKEGKIDIIIGTSAFGMGVDKADVRTVLHACVPENLSRFYQEVGRGGRDGLPSLSVMIPYMSSRRDNREYQITGEYKKIKGSDDLDIAFSLTSKSLMSVDLMVARWRSMLNSAENTVLDGRRIQISLDTVPEYFTHEEKKYAGNRNMVWNANLLLFLHRTGYIEIEEAYYSENEKKQRDTYYFVVKLLKTDALMDDIRMTKVLTPYRQAEFNVQNNGFQHMSNLVRNIEERKKCIAYKLQKLFPLAEPICAGCYSHYEPISFDYEEHSIREPIEIPFTPVAENSRMSRLMFGNKYTIVNKLFSYVDDYDNMIERLQKYEISAIVIPDKVTIGVVSNAVILSYNEFLIIAEYAPKLLRKGFAIFFSDDDEDNSKIFETASDNEFADTNKILFCKENMYLSFKGATVSDCVKYTLRAADYI